MARHTRTYLCSAMLALYAAGGQAAYAQQASGDNKAGVSEGGIADIVVTAQRREENLQRVPIAVTALSSEAIGAANITSNAELVRLAPSLIFDQSAGGSALPYIRGIGTDVTSRPNAEPMVANYTDGVYTAFAVGVLQELYDVERVEVLRGPQGTLFGRNSVAGAINITTKKPSDVFAAKVSGTYGTYNLMRGNAYITGPLAPNLSASIALSASHQDSYFTNVSPKKPADITDTDRAFAGRAKLLWTPGSKFELDVSANYLNTKGINNVAVSVQSVNALSIGIGGLKPTKTYDFAANYDLYAQAKQTGVSARARYDLDFAELVSISAWQKTEFDFQFDFGASDVTLVRAKGDPIASKQFTQEVQIQSPSSSPVKWILGGFYFHENAYQNLYIVTTASTFQHIGVFSDSAALFGQMTYPLTDAVNITGGVRQTWDKKRMPANDEINVAVTPNTVLRQFPGQTKRWSKFTYKAGIDYTPSSDAMLYASYSTGYQSGFYNVNGAPNFGPLEPQDMKAIEIGGKFQFLDRRVRLNVALFNERVSNLVVQQNQLGSDGRAVTVLTNAARARSRGAEVELITAPTDQFTLSASATVLDTEYQGFINPTLVPQTPPAIGTRTELIDVSGTDLVRAPRFSGSLSATYTLPVGDEGKLRLNAILYHTGSYKFEPGGIYRQKAYETLDASISYDVNDRITASAWVKNLTNTHYLLAMTTASVSSYGVYAAPTTAGLTLNFRFGS